MKAFFMLYVEGGNNPKVKHETLEAILIEAERLARLTQKKVHILKSLSTFEVEEQPIKRILHF
jgi:hypothetical protein